MDKLDYDSRRHSHIKLNRHKTQNGLQFIEKTRKVCFVIK